MFPKIFPSLPIPGEIFRFPEEFCFSFETVHLRVDTLVEPSNKFLYHLEILTKTKGIKGITLEGQSIS